MKDTLLVILIFALSFVAFYLVLTLVFLLYLAVVPSGTGLVFENPFSFALYPSAAFAMLFALNRASHKPGRISITLALLTGAMSFLLFFGTATTASLPSPLSPDQIPYPAKTIQDLRYSGPQGVERTVFWYQDSSLGQFISKLFFWTGELTIQFSPSGQFDPIQRKLFPAGGEKGLSLKGSSAESDYFGHRGALTEAVGDFHDTIHTVYEQIQTNPGWAVLWCMLISMSWVGLFFFYGLKEHPLFKWLFLLLFGRLLFWLFPFSNFVAPDILSAWLPKEWISAFPLYFYIVVLCSFWGLIGVFKPHGSHAGQNV